MSVVLNRRDFLVYGGATAAGITLGEAGRRWLARADAKAAAWHAPATERWASSVCRECAAGCGVRVRLMDDRPVKVDGNPLCPIARGRLCAKGQAAIESYFDPDRLVGPARRTGPRGAGKWMPITWDEGIRTLASRLKSARDATLIAFAADERGPLDAAWTRFWDTQHARVARTPPATAERLQPRLKALTGAVGEPLFDLENATHVLSFGAPVVEDWLSPLWAQRSYGRFRRGAGRSRGRLVLVDCRRSLTARKADEWLPVAAEGQPALAYGIASVLLREDRVDREMLKERRGNLEQFESSVVALYTPDAVAAATGIPVVTLLRLARDLAATPRPLVVVGADAPAELVDAVFALNAIVGALDRPGGIFEAPRRASNPGEQVSAATALSELAKTHGRASLVAFRDAAALRDVSAPATLDRLFEAAGFIVSFSPYLDETAAVADLLLPAHTPLESWQAVVPPSSDGTEKLACTRPAAAPRLNTGDLVEVLHRIAERVDPTTADVLPKSSADAVHAELERVYKLRRGTPYANTFETNWVQQLERGGWWVSSVAGSRAFDDAVLDAGGWMDPYFEGGELGRSIARQGGFSFVPPSHPIASRAADVEPAVVSASLSGPAGARTPGGAPALRLITFTPAVVNAAGGPNQPVLFELLGQPDGPPWRVWAELNSGTARQLGIEDGATVRIGSSAGSIDVVVVLVDGMPPGSIAVAYVPAMPSAGRWARLVSADVRKLWRGAAPDEPVTVSVTAV